MISTGWQEKQRMNGQTDLFVTAEQCWEALVNRDQRADGVFFCGVKTTGIYCRPTCPSRLPRRENVLFFKSWKEAEAAGLRPCKRCSPKDKPKETHHQRAIVAACKLIDHAENQPTLEQLAGAAGLSPFYFQLRATTPGMYRECSHAAQPPCSRGAAESAEKTIPIPRPPRELDSGSQGSCCCDSLSPGCIFKWRPGGIPLGARSKTQTSGTRRRMI